MLFNSYTFIFFYLPVTLCIFFLLGRYDRHRLAMIWLVLASLFFYGWWQPVYLWLLTGSITINYTLGQALSKHTASLSPGISIKKGLLSFGIIINLGLLGYFKYANFFIENYNNITGSALDIAPIILPLAISFFTFQQIAYLVDAHCGLTQEHNFLNYCLFVSFFPQLIAGPIVHHKEVMSQFENKTIGRYNPLNLSVGLSIFCIGLFKKVALADHAAAYASPVFNAAENGAILTFLEAWSGVLAYSFEIYFDFSGYSDMAIGLGWMFGIHLPLNFNSPYKAHNIIEFWQRWHMTLSRFLRDYLYIPLGGNRKGKTRRYLNLITTMLLGGLWHGAAWNFVIWGALHGIYLCINQTWRTARQYLGIGINGKRRWSTVLATLLTFVAVTLAWVFFRAKSFDGALGIVNALVGINGIILPGSYQNKLGFLDHFGIQFGHVPLFAGLEGCILLAALLFIVWFAPNTQQIILHNENFESNHEPKSIWSWSHWQPTLRFAAITALLAAFSLRFMDSPRTFVYFQF